MTFKDKLFTLINKRFYNKKEIDEMKTNPIYNFRVKNVNYYETLLSITCNYNGEPHMYIPVKTTTNEYGEKTYYFNIDYDKISPNSSKITEIALTYGGEIETAEQYLDGRDYVNSAFPQVTFQQEI